MDASARTDAFALVPRGTYTLRQKTYPDLNWEQIEQLKESQIVDRVRDNPRQHVESLISQASQAIIPQAFNLDNVKKLTTSIKQINLPSTLFRRLNSIFLQCRGFGAAKCQSFTTAQQRTSVSVEDLVRSHQYLGNLISQTQNQLDINYAEACRKECTTDLFYLLKEGEIKNLPTNSEQQTPLYRIICKNLKASQTQKERVYPALITLINRCLTIQGRDIDKKHDADITHQDEMLRIGFDDLIDNGHNLAKIFSGIPSSTIEDRTALYISMNPAELCVLNPADIIINLYDRNLRNHFLINAPNLDFLVGSKLIALAQFIDSDASRNSLLLVPEFLSTEVLPHLKRMSFLQQIDFTAALSPMLRDAVAKAYVKEKKDFNAEKATIVSQLEKALPYLDISSLDATERAALKALININKPTSAPQKGLDNVGTQTKNPPSFNTIQNLISVIENVKLLTLWTPLQVNPQTMNVLKKLLADLQKRCQFSTTTQKDCSEALDKADFEGLKYEVLKEVLTPIAQRYSIDIMNALNWDKCVATLFDNLDISSLPPKPKKEDKNACQARLAAAKLLFTEHISSLFIHCNSWKDVIDTYKACSLSLEPSKKKQRLCDNDDDDCDDDDESVCDIQTVGIAPLSASASDASNNPNNNNNNDSSIEEGSDEEDLQNFLALLDEASNPNNSNNLIEGGVRGTDDNAFS